MTLQKIRPQKAFIFFITILQLSEILIFEYSLFIIEVVKNPRRTAVTPYFHRDNHGREIDRICVYISEK